MPAFGVLILLAQIACAVHVVRTGRPTFWIYIVVFIPAVGMAAYVLAEVLPEIFGSRSGRRLATGLGRAIDPGKNLREAQRRVAITPTAENKSALAEAHLEAGDADAAIALYREVLTGVHATDPGMMLGLARALFATGDAVETQKVLEKLRAENPGYVSPEGHLLYARSLEAKGKIDDALYEYNALANYFPGQEARCRYAMLLQQSGRKDEARRLFEEVCQAIDYGPSYQRRMQRDWYDIAKRALA